MGKIKGWKKHFNRQGLPKWVRDPGKDYFVAVEVLVWSGNYMVEVVNKNGLLSKMNFKTKAQALKFAIKWMKAHPRG